MTMNDSSCVNTTLSAISDLSMSLYILNFVFGSIFNLLTIFPIWKQVKQKNVLGVFLLCLSISDLLFIFTLPLWIHYYNNGHKWSLGIIACKVVGFFYYSNMYISIFLLCCISVDRWLVVCYPMHFRANRKSRNAWLQCAVVYVAVTLLHIVVLVYDKIEEPLDEKNSACYETYPMTSSVAKFNIIRVIFGFMLPLLVLATSYWRVLTTVGQSPGLNAQAKKKIRLLSYGVIVIFLICFAPYHILLLIRSVVFFADEERIDNVPLSDGPYCKFEQSVRFFFALTLGLSSLNSMVDPVLYVLVTNGIKQKFQLCWRRCRGKPTENALTQNAEKIMSSSLI